jgi:hypothetical protein
MTKPSTWPSGWQPITCVCGMVIGGYNADRPPTRLVITCRCGHVTERWVSW